MCRFYGRKKNDAINSLFLPLKSVWKSDKNRNSQPEVEMNSSFCSSILTSITYPYDSGSAEPTLTDTCAVKAPKKQRKLVAKDFRSSMLSLVVDEASVNELCEQRRNEKMPAIHRHLHMIQCRRLGLSWFGFLYFLHERFEFAASKRSVRVWFRFSHII
jgi:hypothetical protein